MLVTSLSDSTNPLPWFHHTSARDLFVVTQKRVLLHTNLQRIEMLCAISLLLYTIYIIQFRLDFFFQRLWLGAKFENIG